MENALWWQKQRLNDIAASQEKPRTDSDHQKLGGATGGFYPKIQKEPAQPTPWLRTSNLQNFQPKHNFLPLPGRVLQKPDGSKTTKGLDPGATDIWRCGCGLYLAGDVTYLPSKLLHFLRWRGLSRILISSCWKPFRLRRIMLPI